MEREIFQGINRVNVSSWEFSDAAQVPYRSRKKLQIAAALNERFTNVRLNTGRSTILRSITQ